MNRYYSSTWGRFLMPDPYAGSISVSSPQSWNLYAYAGDDPANSADPSGLYALAPQPGGPVWGYNPYPGDGDGGGGAGSGTGGGAGATPCIEVVPGIDMDPFLRPCGTGGRGSSGGGGNLDSRKPNDPDCDPKVIAAMTAAWMASSNGLSGTEAGFALTGTPQKFSIVVLPFTNQQSQISFQLSAGSFAIFHVHPNNAAPQPSRQDISVANNDDLLMFTETSRGLWEYDPSSKNTSEITSGINWTKPCLKQAPPPPPTGPNIFGGVQ